MVEKKILLSIIFVFRVSDILSIIYGVINDITLGFYYNTKKKLR